MAHDQARSPGRPRDSSIDTRVLEAARRLLEEQGFEAATVQAIAAKAGVHASAIYRRWPSRLAIIEQAVYPGFAAASARATGDLHADLRRFIQVHLETLGAPAARAAMPGLLAAYQSAEQERGPATWLAVSARPQFADILRAAPAGSVRPDVDPEDVFDVLLGAIVARVLIPTVVQRDRPAERLVELILRLLQPETSGRES